MCTADYFTNFNRNVNRKRPDNSGRLMKRKIISCREERLFPDIYR